MVGSTADETSSLRELDPLVLEVAGDPPHTLAFDPVIASIRPRGVCGRGVLLERSEACGGLRFI